MGKSLAFVHTCIFTETYGWVLGYTCVCSAVNDSAVSHNAAADRYLGIQKSARVGILIMSTFMRLC